MVVALPLSSDGRPLPADDKAGQKTDKKTDSDTPDKTLPPKNKLVKAGEISGKVVKVDATEKMITIQIAAPNPDVIRSISNLQAQLAASFKSPFPLYSAYCGYGHNGRVRPCAPVPII